MQPRSSNRQQFLSSASKLKLHTLRQALAEWIGKLESGELEPNRFSLSVGTGVFIGLLPIHGLQSMLCLGLVLLLPVEPLLTWLVSWIGNAVTAVPITWLELELGSFLCNGKFSHYSISELGEPNGLARLGLALVVGSLTLALIAGAASYACARTWALRLQAKQNGLGNCASTGASRLVRSGS